MGIQRFCTVITYFKIFASSTFHFILRPASHILRLNSLEVHLLKTEAGLFRVTNSVQPPDSLVHWNKFGQPDPWIESIAVKTLHGGSVTLDFSDFQKKARRKRFCSCKQQVPKNDKIPPFGRWKPLVTQPWLRSFSLSATSLERKACRCHFMLVRDSISNAANAAQAQLLTHGFHN